MTLAGFLLLDLLRSAVVARRPLADDRPGPAQQEDAIRVGSS